MALIVRRIYWVFVALILHDASASHLNTRSLAGLSHWGIRPRLTRAELSTRIAEFPRGGADVDEEDEEYDDEYDYEEEESEEAEDAEDETEGVQIEVNVEKYDEPLVASPMTNLYASLGVMLLARRIDLFSPKVVKIARFAFIAYLILLQLFLLYVRIEAKTIHDRTPITLKNPLSSVLESQLNNGDGGNGGMMKNLASSFLSSKSTVMEYDLKQARSMQSGLIMNMAFMWLLHFKMEQVQPLLIQSVTGIVNMIYSPLFQVYVMGRNLERPFKNPAMKKLEEVASAESADDDTEATESVESVETVDAAEVIAAEEAESGGESESEEEMIEAKHDTEDESEETEATTVEKEDDAEEEEEEEEVEEEESESEAEDEEAEDVSAEEDAEETSEEEESEEEDKTEEEGNSNEVTDIPEVNEGPAETADVGDEDGVEEE